MRGDTRALLGVVLETLQSSEDTAAEACESRAELVAAVWTFLLAVLADGQQAGRFSWVSHRSNAPKEGTDASLEGHPLGRAGRLFLTYFNSRSTRCPVADGATAQEYSEQVKGFPMLSLEAQRCPGQQAAVSLQRTFDLLPVVWRVRSGLGWRGHLPGSCNRGELRDQLSFMANAFRWGSCCSQAVSRRWMLSMRKVTQHGCWTRQAACSK